MVKSSTRQSRASARPASIAAFTAATSPEMTTVYLPGQTEPALSSVTSAALSIASPASTPRAMLFSSKRPSEITALPPFQ